MIYQRFTFRQTDGFAYTRHATHVTLTCCEVKKLQIFARPLVKFWCLLGIVMQALFDHIRKKNELQLQ